MKSYKNKRRSWILGKLPALIIAIVILIIIGSNALFSFNDKEYLVTVTSKERVNSDNDSKYLIFTEDSEGTSIVFENTDSIFRLKFNSSDIYAKLKENKRYKITAVGYRIPFFSSYRNIIKVEESEEK